MVFNQEKKIKNTFLILAISLKKDFGQCPIYQLDWGSVTTACITIFLGETGNEDFVPTGLNSIRYNLSVKILNFSHPKLLLSFKLTLIPWRLFCTQSCSVGQNNSLASFYRSKCNTLLVFHIFLALSLLVYSKSAYLKCSTCLEPYTPRSN